MNKKTSIALFLATTSVVALTSTGSSNLKAEESDLGGLKEWNTDMPIEADFILDEQLKNWRMKQQKQVYVFLLAKEKIVGKL